MIGVTRRNDKVNIIMNIGFALKDVQCQKDEKYGQIIVEYFGL